jgi:hypothetical protein
LAVSNRRDKPCLSFHSDIVYYFIVGVAVSGIDLQTRRLAIISGLCLVVWAFSMIAFAALLSKMNI